MARTHVPVLGKKFGKLQVIARAGADPWGALLYRCRCDCGAEKVARGTDLGQGKYSSCGCLRRESPHALRHGDARGGRRSPEFRSWISMRKRCANVNSKDWPDYGGRGIRCCEHWSRSFVAFLSDMGRKPSPQHSIDRIDNDGNYEPGNCRWATASEQALNRRPKRRQPAAATTVAAATTDA